MSGGRALRLSLYLYGVSKVLSLLLLMHTVDNVKIVPYATPIRDVLQFFCLVKLNQDPENVSPYTIQT